MSRALPTFCRFAILATLAILVILVVGPATAQSTTPAAGTDTCLAKLFAQTTTTEPTCGTCSGQCNSDGVCRGKLAGDVCNNNGGVCTIVGGCGLHDCCKCQNAALAAILAEQPAAP